MTVIMLFIKIKWAKFNLISLILILLISSKIKYFQKLYLKSRYEYENG